MRPSATPSISATLLPLAASSQRSKASGCRFSLTGLDPGRRTNKSFGWKRRRRRSTKCREHHRATHQSSNEKPRPPCVRASPNRSVALIARELGVSDNSLRNWVKQTEIDQAERVGLTTEEREQLSKLCKEVRVLRQEKEILRKALRPSSPGRMGSDESVQVHRSKEKAYYPISLLWRVLKVSRSGYYDWKDRSLSKRARENAALTHQIRQIHERSLGTYGYPRVHAELRALGVRCSRKRVARLMRKAGLCGAGVAERSAPPTAILVPRPLPIS
jgi:transposase-like protein